MYIQELSDTHSSQRIIALTEQLLAGVPAGEQRKLSSSDNIFTDESATDACYLITSGAVEVKLGKKLVYFLEPGDFIAPAAALSANGKVTLSCSEPVSLKRYLWKDVLASMQADASQISTWLQLQTASNTLLLHALSHYRNHGDIIRGEEFTFAPGSRIIEQGDASTHVYRLIAGHAEAFQQGVKVGDVYAGEIFGSIAVFTEQKRTATVVAKEACRIEIIEEYDFLKMLSEQPDLARSMLAKMARKIVDLNDTVLALEPAGVC